MDRSKNLARVGLVLSAFLQGIALTAAAAGSGRVHGTYKLPPNLQRFLAERHPGLGSIDVSTLRETPEGPSGNIHLRGTLSSKQVIEATTREDRARSVALTVLGEEAD